MKVHNDIVSAIDSQSYVILPLLDLSTAFDTVDRKILLRRLSFRFGIYGKALRWFQSYLENRKQVVNVKGATSFSKDLRSAVPQGSVLGPILYVLYTFPFGDVVRSHGLSCPFYADDTQLYCSFKLHDQAASVQAIESCLNDIDAWMLANMLKLSKDKTELLVIGPKHIVNPPITKYSKVKKLSLKIMLRHLFMDLFYLNWISVMPFHMAYPNRLLKGYSMYKTA